MRRTDLCSMGELARAKKRWFNAVQMVLAMWVYRRSIKRDHQCSEKTSSEVPKRPPTQNMLVTLLRKEWMNNPNGYSHAEESDSSYAKLCNKTYNSSCRRHTLWSNASKPEEVKWVCVSRFGFMKALILIYAREVVNHVESCLADGVSVTLRFRPMIMWLGDMRLCIVYSYCTT